jgi:glycosyltransferase involved in cell wall biosynthesis
VSRGLTVGIDARELRGRPTGTGRYLRNLLREWTARGEDRFLAYLNGPGPAEEVLHHERVGVREVGSGGSRGLVWQEHELPAAVQTDAPDVFFSPAYSCPLRLRLPRVTAVHDLSFFSYPQDFALADALRRRLTVTASVRASAAILACSEFTRVEIATRFPDAASRTVHIPLGSDDDLAQAPSRDAARARRGLRGPLLLTVGAILNRRCLPTLLHATALLRRRGVAASLDVVGENRTHPRLDLQRLAEGLGLAHVVHLVGYASEADLAERYAAADVAVFLSEYEGFGLPALEAAARGVPLVVADRPALSEVFGAVALRVDPQDAEAVAGAIARLLREADLRTELVTRGRELAKRLSWTETARRTREVLAAAAGQEVLSAETSADLA